MSENEEKVRSCFVDLLNAPNKTLASGRFAFDVGKESAIWQDILNKLRPQPKSRFFNIGCGWSLLTDACVEFCHENQISLCLMDATEVIAKVRADLSDRQTGPIEFQEGYFPQALNSEFFTNCRFENILAYSILHYVDDPEEFVFRAADLLAPGGRLLIGDIPNPNQRARFLLSDLGRRFEADYRKVDIESIPKYKSEEEVMKAYQARVTGNGTNITNWSLNLRIGDDFIDKTIKRCRAQRMECYVVPQPETLPFCHTRQDLLILRYD